MTHMDDPIRLSGRRVAGRIGTIAAVAGLMFAFPVAIASGVDGPSALRAVRSETRETSPRLDGLAVPLAFEVHVDEEHGQTEFRARGDGYHLRLGATGADLLIRARQSARTSRETPPAEIRLRLVGADPLARGTPGGPPVARVHYLLGNDPARFRTNIPVVERVRFAEVYPGIDAVYYGRQRRLEYDFVVAPGASPETIALEFEGARVRVDATGDLVLASRAGEMRLLRPEVYQKSGHVREPVEGRYIVDEKGRVRFAIGPYDTARPLTIDPVLTYSTYLAGSNVDEPFGVTVDDQGHAYVAGYTWSWDFPTTAGAHDEMCGTGARECWDTDGFDAFVMKVSPDGSSLVWSTFLGGSAGDIAHGVALDGAGRVFVTGETHSDDFPLTADAVQPTPGSSPYNQDAFVTALEPNGAALAFSTYLGGSASENDTTDHAAIAAVGERVCVTGTTESSDFPTTTGAFDTTLGGPRDVFVVCYDFSGTSPTTSFATYLGGGDFDGAGGIAMNSALDTYVVGNTRSSDFPTTAGAFDTTLDGLTDAFLFKFDAGGASVFATLLGGSGGDDGNGVALDEAGRAYMTGVAGSVSGFPTTSGAFDTTSGGSFVTRFDAAGATLEYSTFLAGTSAAGIAVDAAGRASVIGTSFGDFPVTPDAYATTRTGGVDVTFATLETDGAGLVYATYLGGESYAYEADTGRAIALDPAGNAYLVGSSSSASEWEAVPFPTTPGAFDRSGGDFTSGFAARIGGLGGTERADLAVTQTDAPDPVGLYDTLNYTISVSNAGPDEANAVVVTELLADNVSYSAHSGAGWTCDAFSNPIVCTRALIQAGAPVPDLVLEVTPFQAVGPFTATATVTAHEDDLDPSDNIATVESIVDAPDCVDPDEDGFVECYGDCNPPAGLTCGDCGEYDPATYPDAPEQCDYYDNDCDLEVDEGLGPQGRADLSIDELSRLWWTAVADASAYDVVRGDLETMRAYGDLYTGSVCLANDIADLELTDLDDPGLAGGYWYLVRAVAPEAGDCGKGTFDSGGPGQTESRDTWVAYGPCP